MLMRGIRRDSHRRMVVARTWPHDGSAAVLGTGASAVWAAAAELTDMSGHSMLMRGIRRDSHRRVVVARTFPHEGFPAACVDVFGMGAGLARPPGRTLPDGMPRRPSSPMFAPVAAGFATVGDSRAHEPGGYQPI